MAKVQPFAVSQTVETIETLEQWRRAIALRNANEPDGPTTPERAMNAAAAFPAQVPVRRLLVAVDGRDVAYLSIAQAFWTPDPGLFVAHIHPTPEADLESVLTLAEETVQSLGGSQASIWHRTDRPQLGDLLRSRGYAEGQRNPVGMLELASFDPQPWLARRDHLLANGFRIVSVAEYASEHPERWLFDLWRLEMDIFRDVPLPQPFEEVPFDDWKRNVLANDERWEWMFFAIHGDEIAGLTQLFPNWADPKICNTGLTGVRRAYRRQGVAAGLKGEALSRAKAAGFERIYMDNEERNPMLQLNLQMGFRTVHEMVNAIRTL